MRNKKYTPLPLPNRLVNKTKIALRCSLSSHEGDGLLLLKKKGERKMAFGGFEVEEEEEDEQRNLLALSLSVLFHSLSSASYLSLFRFSHERDKYRWEMKKELVSLRGQGGGGESFEEGGREEVDENKRKKNTLPSPPCLSQLSCIPRTLSVSLFFQRRLPQKACSSARRSGACAMSARSRREEWPAAAAAEREASSRLVRDGEKSGRRRRPIGAFVLLLLYLSLHSSLSLRFLYRARSFAGDTQSRSREEERETQKPKREATSERRRANDRSRHDSPSPRRILFSLRSHFPSSQHSKPKRSPQRPRSCRTRSLSAIRPRTWLQVRVIEEEREKRRDNFAHIFFSFPFDLVLSLSSLLKQNLLHAPLPTAHTQQSWTSPPRPSSSPSSGEASP
jgi:hypothetical protein